MPPLALDRLGRIGVWSSGIPNEPAAAVRDGLTELEALGYPAVWFGEAFSRENLSTSALALSWTRELVVATGITNVYARDPAAANAGAKTLGEAFPGSLRARARDQPRARRRAPRSGVRPAAHDHAHLPRRDGGGAVHGPRAGRARPHRPGRARPEDARPRPRPHRRRASRTSSRPSTPLLARERLGAGKVLAPEQAVILTDDADRARELAREHVAFYMTAPNYRNNMLRLGFEEADLDDGGSERLRDAIVVWGDEERDPGPRPGPPRRGRRPRLHPDAPLGRARPRRAATARAGSARALRKRDRGRIKPFRAPLGSGRAPIEGSSARCRPGPNTNVLGPVERGGARTASDVGGVEDDCLSAGEAQ